jgi:hypothetical protein
MARIALSFEDGDVEFIDRALARDNARRAAKRLSLRTIASDFTSQSTAEVPVPADGNTQELNPAADDPPLMYIERVDSGSSRPYWVNLKTKVTSWTPPDNWSACATVTVPPDPSLSSVAGARSWILKLSLRFWLPVQQTTAS